MSEFLSRVKHRFTGKNHGVFHVPTRNDRHPSGTFKIEDDGRLLIYDHGGDSADEILAAVGLRMADLFPEPITNRAQSARLPFPAADGLRVVAQDALLVAASAASVAAGEPVSAIDRDAIVMAAARIQRTLSACGLGGEHARR